MGAPNPFRPGFAEPPSVLAGRDDVLDSADEALAAAASDGYTPRPLLLVGPRGVGKTVLLAEVARRAGTAYGWPTLRTEVAGPVPLAAVLAARAAALYNLVTQAPSHHRYQVDQAVLRAGLAGMGGEVRLTRQPDEASSVLALEAALDGLATAVEERQSGFVLLLDELQVASHDDFAELAALLQYGTGERWPMVVVGAGLPSLRGVTSGGAEPSLGYMERADWHELGLLGQADTVVALQGPATHAGRPMDDDAAELLADATGGYPYAIQLYGKHAWRAARDRDRIDLAAAQAAIGPAGAELDRGLYASRWARTPPREREYLRAAAELAGSGRPVTGRAVAERLGLTTRAVDQYRARLISRGTLVPQGEVLDFAVPGMAGYVLRQPAEPATSRGRSPQAQRRAGPDHGPS